MDFASPAVCLPLRAVRQTQDCRSSVHYYAYLKKTPPGKGALRAKRLTTLPPPYGNLTGLWQMPHALVNGIGILLVADMLLYRGTSKRWELISFWKYS